MKSTRALGRPLLKCSARDATFRCKKGARSAPIPSPRACRSRHLPRLWHLSPGRGLRRGALQGSGLFWSWLEGRSDASRSQMSSSFVFRNCLISPLASPPPQVERCLCICNGVAVKTKEGKVGRSRPCGTVRAGMGRHYTPGLLFVGPGKWGCSL